VIEIAASQFYGLLHGSSTNMKKLEFSSDIFRTQVWKRQENLTKEFGV